MAQNRDKKNVVVLETEGSGLLLPDQSRELAKSLGLFEARRAAVESAGKYLASKGLIEFYENRKEEIYSLAASQIAAQIQQEEWLPVGEKIKYVVRIRTQVQPSDFIKAEITDKYQEKQEAKASFREEMEPSLSTSIDPGSDIAKAYRLFRKRQWRIAMIYLDRLEARYPNWGDLYMAKAIGFYALQETLAMRQALEKACSLDHQAACEDLKILKRVHDLNLEP